MDIFLFLLGVFGAILTVYMVKQQVIPEFRPLFDITIKEDEARERREHIKKTETDIDEMQVRMRNDIMEARRAQDLTVALQTSLAEVNAERDRLRVLEREIKQSQIISRCLGFVFFILLGGVFGSLLAGKIEVAGLSGDLPKYFESIIIGATWTSYMSTIGVGGGQKKVDERIGTALKDTTEKINAIKPEIMKLVTEEISKLIIDKEIKKSDYANKMAGLINNKLDLAAMGIKNKLEYTKTMVKGDMKGIM